MSGSDPTGYSWLSDVVSDDDTPSWAIGATIVAVSAWAIASHYGGGGGADAAVGAGIGGSATSVGGGSIGIAHAGYGFANAPSGSNPAPTGEFGSAAGSQGGLYNENVGMAPAPPGGRLACFDDFCGSWGTPELDRTAREAAVTGTVVGMEVAASFIIPELAVSRLVWLLRVWRTMRGADITLKAAVGSAEAANAVQSVLKGTQSLSVLTIKQRAYASAFYRDVATRTTGKYAAEASRYNVARAEFLEGTRATLAPSLPEFIKAGL